MTLHIDEIHTDVQVQPEPEAGAAPAAAEPPWQQLARLRQLQQQLLRDAQRTSAWGNED